jgi:hypothetical protein
MIDAILESIVGAVLGRSLNERLSQSGWSSFVKAALLFGLTYLVPLGLLFVGAPQHVGEALKLSPLMAFFALAYYFADRKEKKKRLSQK